MMDEDEFVQPSEHFPACSECGGRMGGHFIDCPKLYEEDTFSPEWDLH